MRNMRCFFVCTVFICAVMTSRAQESQEGPGEMITDRPDETEAPSTVAKGYLQIESGFFYRDWRNDPRRHKEWAYNTTLLRYGLLDNLELRLGTDVVQLWERPHGQEIQRTETGFEPLLAGVKFGIAEENGIFPEIGFMGHVRLPFAASEQFRPENMGVDFRFAFTHTLNENSDLSYNFGAEWHNDASRPTYIYTISYGYDLTDQLGIYGELYGDLHEDESAEHFWDAGITYLLSQNFQLDAFVGTGINAPQQLWTGAGFSWRIPN